MLYTHYDYLDLAPGASQARIEAAYQSIKKRFDSKADEAMVRLIHEAYNILSDPPSRNGYDRELQRQADQADAELKAALDTQIKHLPRRVQDVPPPLRAALTAWAA